MKFERRGNIWALAESPLFRFLDVAPILSGFLYNYNNYNKPYIYNVFVLKSIFRNYH